MGESIPKESFENLVKFHEKFILQTLQERGKLVSQVSYNKKKEMIVMVCDGREAVRFALAKAKSKNPDWIVSIAEGYGATVPKEHKEEFLANFQRGDLEKRFKAGDKSIKETVTMLIYTKGKSKLFSFDILLGECGRIVKIKKDAESEEFDGYLT